MTEILTESFCERCGTRYTFQTAAPRKVRSNKIKVLSRGLKNYVLSDETTLEEAFADARSDEERATSSQQLEAFHQTFNFCMSCRQYTCSNCWNEGENRCLSCAPDLSREILPAPFPDLPAHGLLASTNGSAVADFETDAEMPSPDSGPEAWPEVDLDRLHAVVGGTNGSTDHDETHGTELVGQSEVDTKRAADAQEIGAAAMLAAALVETPDEAVIGDDAVAVIESAESVDRPEAAATIETTAIVEEPVAPAEVLPVDIAATSAEATPSEALAPSADTDERAAAAAAQTSALFAKFRPGQSLDAELEAYEREQAAADDTEARERATRAAEAAVVAAAIRPDAAPEPEAEAIARPEPEADERLTRAAEAAIVAAAIRPDAAPEAEPEPQPEPEAVAWPEQEAAEAVEAEPAVAETVEPEPVVAAIVEPELPVEPVAAAEPEPEPAAATDIVEQPTWRIVAPDTVPAQTDQPPAAPVPSGAPEWPPVATNGSGPEWPTAAFLPSTTSRDSARDAMWAASSLDVAKAGGVQSCVSCGLSLSANARFCRRCGTRQGG